jgi:histone-lysine N-methyltransferase SETMAR
MTSQLSSDSGLVARRKWEVLQHPPHSPDLAPSDFHLFGPFKNISSGKRFEDQNDFQKTVVQYFTSLGKDHYRKGMLDIFIVCKTMG